MTTDDGSTHLGRRRPGTDTPAGEETGPTAPASSVHARSDGAGVDDPSATRLGRRRAPATPISPTPPVDAPAASAPSPTGDDEVLRFGPGVPSWGAGAASGTGCPKPPRRRPQRRVGAVLTLAIVAGVVLYLFLRGGDPLVVRSMEVRAEPARASCDATVDLIGTVNTNGSAGTLRYQWTRSDGQTSEVLSQSVGSGVTSTDVRLQWSVSGEGSLDARATLRVLDPAPSEAVGGFTYSCP